MNSKSLRRLAADHGSLHTAGLPPNYLFPSSSDGFADLTSLDVLLAGPVGTPYASGVWRLHLDIPPAYPTAPPTAQFRTRLWHPNIEEATGSVCVETLKRDWSSTLKLRDVLVTISCLLIQPNPASALNEAAGKLASEDWETYCRRAKLMTEIHAAVPDHMVNDVKEAQMRGEDTMPMSEPSATRPQSKVRGKEHTVIAPSTSKLQRLAAEDEENTQRHGETQEPDSGAESDWIPHPGERSKAPAVRRDQNIFGIQGLNANKHHDSPHERIFVADTLTTSSTEQSVHNDGHQFITVATKHRSQVAPSFELLLPPKSTSILSLDTPELLKFSHQNPFSPIQPNNQTHPLLRDFSYPWDEIDSMHSTSTKTIGASRAELRMRTVDDSFAQRKTWEMKKFKKAAYDLGRYNRGDFGPRTGIGRL